MNDVMVERTFRVNDYEDDINSPDVVTYSDYGGSNDYVQFQDDAGVIVTFHADDIESIIDILHQIQQIRQPERRKPKPYAYR